MTMTLQQFPAMTSGCRVEEFVPWKARKTFYQFEKLNEVSSVTAFLKGPQTKLTEHVVICQASKFGKQASKTRDLLE